ncbi:MAG: hypothetical protein JSS07_09320 [Proteobacteria bacterium]|nr:hypothetical protein [Pseudomonadota bacterium]
MQIKALLLTYLLAIPPLLIAASPHDDPNTLEKVPKIPIPLLKQNNPDLPQQGTSSINNKKEWMVNIEQTLPGLLCDSKHYFVTCFKITQQECVDFTQLLVHGCLSNVAVGLPAHLDKAQGEYWGQMIGKCSYDLYEKFMKSKKLNKENCQDTKKTKKP